MTFKVGDRVKVIDEYDWRIGTTGTVLALKQIDASNYQAWVQMDEAHLADGTPFKWWFAARKLELIADDNTTSNH